MTDHTPGPWHYGDNPYGPKVSYVHSDEWLIAQVMNHKGERATDHANGHLLAAAPDLLAACEAIAEWSDEQWCNHDCSCAHGVPSYHLNYQLHSAIGKARGEAP